MSDSIPWIDKYSPYNSLLVESESDVHVGIAEEGAQIGEHGIKLFLLAARGERDHNPVLLFKPGCIGMERLYALGNPTALRTVMSRKFDGGAWGDSRSCIIPVFRSM